MAEPVQVQVLKMTPNTNRQKRKHLSKWKIIANLSKLLSRKSLGGDCISPEYPAPILISGKQLTSDLLIHPPANGKFTTVLQLNQVLGNDIKLVVVKVYGTELQILLAKKSHVKCNGKNYCQDQGKLEYSWKDIIKKLGLAKKNRRKCNESLKEDDMIVHGQICLPDYINSETLQFSMNCFSDLQIKANI